MSHSCALHDMPEPADAIVQESVSRTPRCPLCGGADGKASWLGSTTYAGRTYAYVECLACGSLYCDPMPAAETLARLYGPEYQMHLSSEDEGNRQIAGVLRYLTSARASSPGTFVDFGCGRGRLLTKAAHLGWRTVGVEFDGGVAAAVGREVGIAVLDPAEAQQSLRECADVLHLGDVLEHLTAMDEQLPAILNLIAPGGVLIAQGPLESNTSLFTFVLRMARVVARSRTTTMPPYHVLLATARGQRQLFARFGLLPVQFDVSEVAWPAPSRVGLRDLARPRIMGLFALRLVSRGVSRVFGGDWGNRYFYVGSRRDGGVTRGS